MRRPKGGVDLSFVTPMKFGCTCAQLSRWRMLLNLAGDGADLRLADFVPSEVRRIVEDRDMSEVSSIIQFRCPGSKYTPNLGQQKPVHYRTHL